MPAQVTVVGSLNMDLVVRSPRIPSPGETIIGHDFHTVPGGKGANQAIAAARMGAQVAMVGRVGNDAFGQALLDNLATAGVEHNWVLQDTDVATGVALITVDDNGQNSIVVVPGANMRLSSTDVERAEAAIAAADVVLLQLESPLETVVRAAKLARAHHKLVVLNPAPARPLPSDLLSLVNVLIPNESETALLTGRPVENLLSAQEAAVFLLDQGLDTVILTLGERGAMLAHGREVKRFPAFQVKVVDTTAAGDAFVAGFAVALAEGQPLEEAVRWGNAAGALAATKLGAQPSLPTRDELKRLLAEGVLRTD